MLRPHSFFQKCHLKSGAGLQPGGITSRVLKSPHVKSQLQERQHEETFDSLGRAEPLGVNSVCPVVRSHPLGSRDTPVAARCGVDSHLVFPVGRSSVQFDGRRTPMIKLIKHYHPERHYMRGPGPKWFEKHSSGIDRVTGDRHGGKHSLRGLFFQLLLGRRA